MRISKEKATLEFLQEQPHKAQKMKTKVKWYNDPQIVGTLLIFWLPVGIYGLYKSETINSKWKLVTYLAIALACILLAAIII